MDRAWPGPVPLGASGPYSCAWPHSPRRTLHAHGLVRSAVRLSGSGLMVRALASEEGWPLADIRGPRHCPWDVIFHPKVDLLLEDFWKRNQSPGLQHRVAPNAVWLSPVLSVGGRGGSWSAWSRCPRPQAIAWPAQSSGLASLWKRTLTSDDLYELMHQGFGLFLFLRPRGVSFLGGSPSSLHPPPHQLSTHCQDH